MKQNKYDDPAFFEEYSKMPRSIGGLEQAGEWPALRAPEMILENPKLKDESRRPIFL